MEKYKVRKRLRFDKRFILILFLGVVTVGMFDVVTYTQNSQDIRSRAYDAAFCADKCTGQDRCGNGPPGDPNYNDPCCADLKRTGDPFACPWPQRGYCTDDQCASIPAGVDRQRCGGPRHSWCNLCIDNGCPGYGNAPPPTKPPPPPTRPPKPTSTPPPLPPQPTDTQPPRLPTDTPFATQPPDNYITQPPIVISPTLPPFVSPTSAGNPPIPSENQRPFVPPTEILPPPSAPPPPRPNPIIISVIHNAEDIIQKSISTIFTFLSTILP